MTTGLILATAALVIFGIAGVVSRRSTDPRQALTSELDDRLATALAPGTGSHLDRPPTVRRLAVVDRRDEKLVPIVRVDLETTDAPGMELIFEYVAAVLEAIHPVVVDYGERVHHYDVEFTFGPDGLLVAGECRRVSVPPALADRLCDEETYRAFDLWQDVKRGDRREDTETTLWGTCMDDHASDALRDETDT